MVTAAIAADMSATADDSALATEPAKPKPIVRLSEDVVNQIAAAEIIHRPANAIKELVENSLDAGSTSIKVTLKDGGLKLLQIQDNGSGIRKADLPLLCERFATSKITTFTDLESLTTYGFRGEALASISFVSRMSVTTKVRGEACGWKVAYRDGRMCDANGAPKNASQAIKASAGNDGTTITAEDLFYNVPLRRKSFKSPAEEYNRVIDVVTRYAIHNPTVSWVCKKAGSAIPEVSTPSNSTTQANIALLYGAQLARELLPVPATSLPELGVRKIEGWVTNANWNQKRMVFLLFINHRLVESSKIRKAIDALYTAYLPKGTSPYVYLSLEIEPDKIDVNVHPTKSEVHFLNEEEIIENMVSAVGRALSNANASRTFEIQTLLPGASDPRALSGDSSTPSAPAQKPAPQYKVRMNYQDRTLESMRMFAKPNPSQMEVARPSTRPRLDGSDGDDEEIMPLDDEPPEAPSAPVTNLQQSEVTLKSVKTLRKNVEKEQSADLTEILRKHHFIGLVPDLPMALVQEGTKMYMLDYSKFADELFYQLALLQFGSLGTIELDPPPPVASLLRIAVDAETGLEEAGLDPEHIFKTVLERLIDRREMLEEYFSVTIDDDGRLVALPNLLPGFLPDLYRLPSFVLCAGVRVDWNSEQECFESFARELALLFSPRLLTDVDMAAVGEDVALRERLQSEREHAQTAIEHVLFPALRRYGRPSREIVNSGAIRQLANLPDLYKVFERC